ncbi:cytochrome c [Ruegeria pomeroyi]|uniref:Cytochrome c n=1 Tax=Ruegeria pomeroyi TaxID=89184 RepID=A0A9Q3WLT5_9RHOB|nr:cytochrome c [Ruegeria pomeroyi]
MNRAVIISLAVAVVVAAYVLYPRSKAVEPVASNTGVALVSVTLPQSLSENARIGARVYEAKCLVCHGPNAEGQDGVAPPLVHKIYEPSHHGDEAFQRAVSQGVRAHHWRFGDMPPVQGLSRADVAMIISYVRELQIANGIR